MFTFQMEMLYKDSDTALNAGGIAAGVGAGLVINDDDKKSRVVELERKVKDLEEGNKKLKDENLALQIDLAHSKSQIDNFENQRRMELDYLEKIKDLEVKAEIKSLPPGTSLPYNPPVIQTETQAEKEQNKDEHE